MVAGHRGNYRITTGQWMVSQEQHRLAAGWNLNRANRSAFAGQFLMITALQWRITGQTDADPVGLRGDTPQLAAQTLDGVFGKPVGARPHHHIEGDNVGGGRQLKGWRFVQGYAGAVDRCGKTQSVASRQRFRTKLRQGIGGQAAEHGVTSKPPRIAR